MDELHLKQPTKQEEAVESSTAGVSAAGQNGNASAVEQQNSSESQLVAVVSKMKKLDVTAHNSKGPKIILEPLQGNSIIFKIRGTDYSYEGETFHGKMHGSGLLALGSNQCLQGKWETNRLVGLSFCRLKCDAVQQTVSVVKQHADYLLSTCGDDFLAFVSPNGLEDLDFTASIEDFKTSFFGKLVVSDVFRDTVRNAEGSFSNEFMTELNRPLSKKVQDEDPIAHLNNLMFLCKHSTRQNLLSMLSDENAHTIPLIQAASNVRTSKALQSLNFSGVLTKVVSQGISQYREKLANMCPKDIPLLNAEIERLPASKILYMTKEDLSMFDRLVTLPCFVQHDQFFEQLVDRYIQTVNKIEEYTPPSEVIPLMSPVYFYLVKSFVEVISEIIEIEDELTSADLTVCCDQQECFGWPVDQHELQETGIPEPLGIEKTKINLSKALKARYYFISELMEHYSPDKYVKGKIYEYEFRMLNGGSLSTEKSTDDANDLVADEDSGLREPDDLSDGRLLWLYILDHTLFEVFKVDDQRLKPYDYLLRRHMSFGRLAVEDHESFRVLTDSILKFIIYSAPYAIETCKEPSDDVIVFTRQMKTIIGAYREMERHPITCRYVIDLVAECSRYWSLRSLIIIEHGAGYFSHQVLALGQKLIRIVMKSLSEPAPTTTWVGYCRSVNSFLNNLRDIDFFACWFVESEFNDPEIMEKVGNYFSNKVHRVTDIAAFVHVLQTRCTPLPNHHVIQIASKWLECVELCLGRQWKSKVKPLHGSRLECAGLLLGEIGRLFVHLPKRSNFVDYDAPETHLVEPFVRLLNWVSDPVFFSKRVEKIVNLVEHSAWCIGIVDRDTPFGLLESVHQSLQLLKTVNNSVIPEKLLDCYELFLQKYGHYILKCSSLLSEGKPRSIVRKQGTHYSKWTEEFKTREIPLLLAGVSAMWSSSAQKFQVPHHLQILCIFRMLGVDRSEGLENHLAQVMPGQGKSVVLALLAATLALTGHDVKILCYNEYLCSRDETNFKELFEMAEIGDKIEYVTFQGLVGFLRRSKSFSSLIVDRVKNHTAAFPDAIPNTQNPVLLIDEVDTLFSQQFYGNVHSMVASTLLDGMGKVQQEIWSRAKSKKWEAQQIVQLTKKFIDGASTIKRRSVVLNELNSFRNKPGSFSLLDTDCENGRLCVKDYTNGSLLEDRLLKMAKSALRVAHSYVSWARSDFEMVSEDVMCSRYPDCDIIDDLVFGYCNTFNFLRSSSTHNHENTNYGRLLLNSGRISYAQVPSVFPLILGVGGTLTNLMEYEKAYLDAQRVKLVTTFPPSIEPGEITANFVCVNRVDQWQWNILKRAKDVTESGRAALIFFESEKDLHLVTKEPKFKFDRINVITEKTDSRLRDTYVSEAGLPGTVTLATRCVSRGVDYTSSPEVEEEGGIHVIQTFLSVDIKEETHIKGRTGRQGNNGSYELLLCKKHLIRENIIPPHDPTIHTYSSLNDIRFKLMDELGNRLTAKLDVSNRDHNTTMKFFGLL